VCEVASSVVQQGLFECLCYGQWICIVMPFGFCLFSSSHSLSIDSLSEIASWGNFALRQTVYGLPTACASRGPAMSSEPLLVVVNIFIQCIMLDKRQIIHKDMHVPLS
jgi:hypothetical protein